MSAVITGAAGALGSQVASTLASRGMKLVLVDRPEARARLDEIAKATNGFAAPADITKSDAWGPLLAGAEKALGEPATHAALIAGTWTGGKPMYELDDAVFAQMIATNLETAYRTMRALLPGMVARKSGSIVVVGARAAIAPETAAGSAAYAAAKAGVVALMKATAAEVLAHGVRLNAVLPSTMDTPANRRGMPNADFAKWVATSSVADVIAFLLSDAARDVSGSAVPVFGQS
jgi:NAD(P)-dependent dehydrogenase (short-subunit alcohol dehydrogenase family)